MLKRHLPAVESLRFSSSDLAGGGSEGGLLENELPPALFFEVSTRRIVSYVFEADRSANAGRRRHKGGLAPHHLKLAKAMLSVRDHDSVTLLALSAACGLSTAHFAREFKKSTNFPPHQWALLNKVARAKDMLLRTTRSIPEIADECGFVDHSHFGRWFKRATGLTPKAWQRLRRKTDPRGVAIIRRQTQNNAGGQRCA
ncbi:helix-turn-helix domain-containing protein [Paraburkholderia unamae]|uniref:AraC-like DNA-binding protein n=1 Tax=Paraburkholderia unamae TaxID=219649 RepID=A0ABX5KLD9_9BURK|nr:AraC family transcriptional regulator [Paraburkholderia unamae]PVX81839.1 AraC-like DNA-binding protein [Paraburkholderia unamae]